MWIRWKTKASASMSLWHRADPGHVVVRRASQETGQVEIGLPVPPGGRRFTVHTMSRQTACGFRVPPFEAIEDHADEPAPMGPRCVWCLHGWVVDVSPGGGAPPTGSGASRVIRLFGGKKRPPTLHA